VCAVEDRPGSEGVGDSLLGEERAERIVSPGRDARSDLARLLLREQCQRIAPVGLASRGASVERGCRVQRLGLELLTRIRARVRARPCGSW
jgi:hypothetical protein